MRYLLLIAGDESQFATATAEQGAAMTAEYGEFTEAMADRGVLQGGERLRPSTDATTVRVRDGEVTDPDGPFAETKEQIGGFYLVDCKDLDEAIEVAAKIPGAAHREHRSEADLGDVSPDVGAAVAEAFRDEWGRVVATLIRLTGDWDLAEECAQDAFARALERWPGDGVPAARRVADDRGPEPGPRSDAPQPAAARRSSRKLPR